MKTRNESVEKPRKGKVIHPGVFLNIQCNIVLFGD